MFYVYQCEYGYAIDVLTSAKATLKDFDFARKAGYFATSKEAYAHVSKFYP